MLGGEFGGMLPGTFRILPSAVQEGPLSTGGDSG